MSQVVYGSEICLYAYIAPITLKIWIGANDEIKIVYGVSVHGIVLEQTIIPIIMYICIQEHVTHGTNSTITKHFSRKSAMCVSKQLLSGMLWCSLTGLGNIHMTCINVQYLHINSSLFS